MCGGWWLCCCLSCRTFSSAGVRIMYFLLFALTISIAWLMRSSALENALEQSSNSTSGILDFSCTSTNSYQCYGILGSYRVVLGYVFFQCFMLITTFGSSRRGDVQGSIHSSWWLVKFLILAGIIFGCFFIDDANIVPFFWAAFSFSVVFLVTQLLIFLGSSYSWADGWIKRAIEDGETFYKCFLYFISAVLFILFVTANVLMFVYFTSKDGCDFNKFLISFNFVLFVIAAVTSLLPKVQEANKSANILPVLIMGVFQTYLCWTALASQPYGSGACYHFSSPYNAQHVPIYSGMVFLFIVLWWHIVNADKRDADGRTPWNQIYLPDGDEEADKDTEPEYNFTLFHFILLVCSCYGLMVLTGWNSFESGGNGEYQLAQTDASFWLNIIFSWLAWLTLEWSLIAPLCCPNIEFGN